MDIGSDQFDWFKASSNKQFENFFRQNRDNIEALRLKQLANQEIEKSRDFESMEKYRQMGLSEDEAKIHLKREKRAEKIENERYEVNLCSFRSIDRYVKYMLPKN